MFIGQLARVATLLDLVISDSDNTVVTDVRPGSFISDHESVLFELTHPKPQTEYTVVKSRKMKIIYKAKFKKISYLHRYTNLPPLISLH